MAWVSIVSWDQDGRVTRYAPYDTQSEAEAHSVAHGGFAHPIVAGPIDDWLVQGGNTLVSSPLVKPPPPYVSRYQFKRAVLDSGQLAAVKAAYSGLSEEAKLYWDEADRIGRDSVLITELKAALSLSDNAVDNFFRNAQRIEP